MSQIPTVGKIVNYTQPEDEEPIGGQCTHAAIVTRVFAGDIVDLTVFFPRQAPQPRSDVPSFAGMTNGHWSWPERVA